MTRFLRLQRFEMCLLFVDGYIQLFIDTGFPLQSSVCRVLQHIAIGPNVNVLLSNSTFLLFAVLVV